MSLKTENSRRVAKSRPVCMGLKAKKKICGFPVSRPYLAFGRQNPDPKLFY